MIAGWTRSARQGRPRGGPFVCLAVALAACGGAATGEPTSPAEALARPLETYRELGFLTGPGDFPGIIDVTSLAGPADSTWVLFGLSLPANALRFQRDGGGFIAPYQVAVEFRREGRSVRRFERQEAVRVRTFAETARSDESVVFQQSVLLGPGRYGLHVRAAGDGGTALELTDTVDVPRFGAARPAAGPVFIHDGVGRASLEALPSIILNPRHTVAYGGAEPNLYMEWYGAGEEVPVTVRILDTQRELLSEVNAVLPAGTSPVRTLRLRIPVDKLPLGRLWVELSAGGFESGAHPLVLSISDQWMVANFDEVVLFLHSIATTEEVEALSAGTPAERRAEWERFWTRRDPIRATPQNEYRDEFFARVRYATEHFAEPGALGWRTDRGEVYIVLGPPDLVRDRADVGTDPNASGGIEWRYESVPGGRLSLLFVDRTGFGRYRLTPSSAAAFRTVADRLKPGS